MARRRLAVVKHARAVLDIIEIADYLAQAASLASADRFVDAVERTIDRLAAFPGTGVRYDPENPAYVDIRIGMVDRFRSYLIVYRAEDDRLEVLRVLHGARDVGRILADTFEPG
jgi:toxin ParE1/3/4